MGYDVSFSSRLGNDSAGLSRLRCLGFSAPPSLIAAISLRALQSISIFLSHILLAVIMHTQQHRQL